MFTPIKEFRIIAVKGQEVIELENGYVSEGEAHANIPLFANQYPGYEIKVEEY